MFCVGMTMFSSRDDDALLQEGDALLRDVSLQSDDLLLRDDIFLLRRDDVLLPIPFVCFVCCLILLNHITKGPRPAQTNILGAPSWSSQPPSPMAMPFMKK